MKQSIDILNDLKLLLQMNYQALDFYKMAVFNVEDEQLKAFSLKQIKSHQKFIRDLIREAIILGGNPLDIVSLRTYKSRQLKPTSFDGLERKNNRIIISSFLKGERLFCKKYNTILQKNLLKNTPIEDILKNHKADAYLAVSKLEQLSGVY